MTITFHTSYPNTPAVLIFGGVTSNLTTDKQGNLYMLENPDGTYPFTITISGKTYDGTVTVTANTGYVDLSEPPILLYALIGIGGAIAGYFILRKVL